MDNLVHWSVRDILLSLLQNGIHIDAFCVDYYPQLYQRFSPGMDNQQKLTIIISEINQEDIISALEKKFSKENVQQVIERVNEASLRRANPSKTSIVLRFFSRRALAITAIVALSLTVALADTVRWREYAVAYINSITAKDPSLLLEKAWLALDQREFAESRYSARCVIYMTSASEEQKARAKVILSLALELESRNGTDTQIENIKNNPAIATHMQTLRKEITEKRAALTVLPPGVPAPTNSPLDMAATVPRVDAGAARITDLAITDLAITDLSVLRGDLGSEAQSPPDMALKQADMLSQDSPPGYHNQTDSSREHRINKKSTRRKLSQPTSPPITAIDAASAALTLKPIQTQSKEDKSEPVNPVLLAPPAPNSPGSLPDMASPASVKRNRYTEQYVDKPDFDQEALKNNTPNVRKCLASYKPESRYEFIRIIVYIPSHSSKASSVTIFAPHVSGAGNPPVQFSDEQGDCIKESILRIKFDSGAFANREHSHIYQPFK